MNKLSGANVGRLLNLPFLKPRFKVCLFARVADNLPCLRFQVFAMPAGVNILELVIVADISGGAARASLRSLRLS